MEKLLATGSAYLLKPGRDQLCNEVSQWKSELEFYTTELSFFEKLLDKNNHVIINPGDYKEMEQEFTEVNGRKRNQLIQLLNEVTNHEKKILQVIENDEASDLEESTLFSHHELQNQIVQFVSDYKIMKQRIFLVVEKNVLLTKKARETVRSGKVVF
ncbi:MAG TPA: hypothetical protein PLI47_01660 [Bacteroidia bacterium]|jgi:hypothetical protein|nr:hypothetical protein [Bacteroidota bacterium]MBP9790522.1 hypothetical protein [Bacteroidia bacterium]MBP9923769.1 hypothetical protein [Bacteroidia bacterium]HQW21976.1 hypothetical protein [Bacteroidia bacterium]